MAAQIRDCLPPDRNPRKPKVVLPKGAVDTHVHIFEPGYKLSPDRGYNPPDSPAVDSYGAPVACPKVPKENCQQVPIQDCKQVPQQVAKQVRNKGFACI